MERQLFLAAYDVAEPKRLARALKLARRHATGGQKSVFECWMAHAERRALLAGARRVLHQDVDRFFLVRLDPRQPARLIGLAEPVADPHFFYHG
ncbi:MAG: CRISPR-associated endonuclease Cas2 [Mariprofundaceae bacterium]